MIRPLLLEHYLVSVLPNKPYSKEKHSTPWNSMTTNYLLLGAILLQPLLKVVAKEGLINPILTQLVPYVLNHITITKSMKNRFAR